MGLLDVNVNYKEPITPQDLVAMGFKKRKDNSWEYVIRFKNHNFSVIRYFPRGTYNGVRLRNSRLVFKDINYKKFEKRQHKEFMYTHLKPSEYPRTAQVVIKNPGKNDIEMCKYQVFENMKTYNEYIADANIYYNSKSKKLSYEKWLKDHSNI